ncbi:hypothetical protein [Nemorincola caseinilytica]
MRTDTVSVGSNDVDEQGIYTTCNMLQMVARTNDVTIMEAFGISGLSHIRARHYSMDLTGKAILGDNLRITSLYTLTGRRQLQVQVYITRTSKRQTITICTGYFIFINRSETIKNTSYHADTVLA